MQAIKERQSVVSRRFHELYGNGEARWLAAPARLNILGEHVDYVAYLPTTSLTFGSGQHAMLMAYRPNADGLIRGASMHAAYEPFTFALSEAALSENTSWESYLMALPAPSAHWSNYVAGAVRYAQWQHGAQVRHGIDFLIDSTIPACGGSSSSSALTCLVGAALRTVNELSYDPRGLALDSSRAEWFVGTRGGAMDHQTICLAQPDAAVVIHHDTRQTETLALPATGYVWVTFFSHEADKGSGVMLEYNERAAVSRFVIPAFFQGSVSDLPVAMTLLEFAREHPDAYGECARLFPRLAQARASAALPVWAYAEHHAGEVRRVAQALEWLRKNPELQFGEVIGALLNETHASLRDLYGISTSEVETVRDLVVSDSAVAGARLMGGGFGGNVLALVKEEAAAALIERMQREFYAPRGRDSVTEGAVMISTPGAGLREVHL
jgi:galactokinase